MQEKQLYIYFKRQTGKIEHKSLDMANKGIFIERHWIAFKISSKHRHIL